jgi:hypothetical protein
MSRDVVEGVTIYKVTSYNVDRTRTVSVDYVVNPPESNAYVKVEEISAYAIHQDRTRTTVYALPVSVSSLSQITLRQSALSKLTEEEIKALGV